MKTVIVTFSSRSGGNCSQIGNLIASMTKNPSFSVQVYFRTQKRGADERINQVRYQCSKADV